ncbi:hypothetical protein OV079_22405 [Nannocystis pusilla]|uniref:Uncharacterized protein n=1 Tax=Nannocystis pusilla TaxID=889268 RepID=A0A9X3IY96_9BACT|nr:hypothetical protein [Nannocystis pusilla]MCY1008261.1 hypothetical protein [Nannocystis pusilla]
MVVLARDAGDEGPRPGRRPRKLGVERAQDRLGERGGHVLFGDRDLVARPQVPEPDERGLHDALVQMIDAARERLARAGEGARTIAGQQRGREAVALGGFESHGRLLRAWRMHRSHGH